MKHPYQFFRFMVIGGLIIVGSGIQPVDGNCLALDEELRVDRTLGLLERPWKIRLITIASREYLRHRAEPITGKHTSYEPTQPVTEHAVPSENVSVIPVSQKKTVVPTSPPVSSSTEAVSSPKPAGPVEVVITLTPQPSPPSPPSGLTLTP